MELSGDPELLREGGDPAREEESRLDEKGEPAESVVSAPGGLSLPVGPLPSGGRLAGGRWSVWRRYAFSSSNSATLCSRAYARVTFDINLRRQTRGKIIIPGGEQRVSHERRVERRGRGSAEDCHCVFVLAWNSTWRRKGRGWVVFSAVMKTLAYKGHRNGSRGTRMGPNPSQIESESCGGKQAAP